MNRMLNKLIAFFVGKTKGYITKIQLVKFLYLADLYAVKWTSQQLTDLDWRYYLHGPWSEEIETALSLMAGHEVILERRGKAILIRAGPELAEVELPISVALMLENIRREWAGMEKVDELLSYVYSTAPMIEAQEKYRPEELAPLNLMREQERLEKMLAEAAPDESLDDLATELIERYGDRGLPLRYWCRETLFSVDARLTCRREPDLKPLPTTGDWRVEILEN